MTAIKEVDPLLAALITPQAIAEMLDEGGFGFPFKLHDYQLEGIADAVAWSLASGHGNLLRHKVGEGKTAIALATGLCLSVKSKVEQILALMPPVLIDQFAEFVESIKGVGPPLVYRGTPKERAVMSFEQTPVVIMSYNIFRSDFERIRKWARGTNLFVIGDELSLKAPTQTFKKVKELLYQKQRVGLGDRALHDICALNATPVSDRGQVYFWCSIFSPGVYPSKKMFELTHVDQFDHWNNPIKWKNTDLMDENFDRFSVWTDKANLQLPPATYTEIPYALTPAHAKLYEKIEEAEFENLPEDVIEMAVEALFATLQRVVLVPKEYGLDIDPPIIEIIDNILSQLEEEDRLIVYTRHVAVSKMLAAHYPQAVSVFGGVAGKKENLKRFKAGDAQIMVANIDSLSKGANMQVANHTVFAELPFRADTMLQCCGRTHRQGQTRPCFFHLPVAKGTIQRQILGRLLANDEDLLNFNRSKTSLRNFLKSC